MTGHIVQPTPLKKTCESAVGKCVLMKPVYDYMTHDQRNSNDSSVSSRSYPLRH